MKRKFVILPLLLFIGAMVMAQGNVSRPYATYGATANRGTLGVSSELTKGRSRAQSWFYGGPILSSSTTFSKGRTSSSSNTYGNAASYSIGVASLPKVSFRGSSRSASASHSTYTNNGSSGKSVNSLGLTSAVTSGSIRYHSSGGSFTTAPAKSSTTRKTTTESHEATIETRTVGSIKTVTTDAGGATFTQFSQADFNDAVPDAESGPMGDAVAPMLLLLGLLVAYKKWKK